MQPHKNKKKNKKKVIIRQVTVIIPAPLGPNFLPNKPD